MRLESLEVYVDGRLVSQSAERNKGPICEVLKQILPACGTVLEISSGTGQHVVHFASAMPHLVWQPTERDADGLQSIASWLAENDLANVLPPLRLDVHDRPWPVASCEAVVCINMIHIAPWSATQALVRGASAILPVGGRLCLYGPFRQQGRHTSPGNEAFDRQLRSQNEAWSIRDLENVAALAGDAGFNLDKTIAMPANNLSVIFQKR